MTNTIGALVDELYLLGVREVVISPGSRNTPLGILFCEHQFETFVHIDERSAGFFALGLAKELERPVVLVCTSGSAAANYFPAIVEAKHAQVPLIVLTADRPPELRQVSAPQTIDQLKIYGDFVKYFEEMAPPQESESMFRYARVVAQKGFGAAFTKAYGVAHVNIPIREPFIPELSRLDFTVGRGPAPFEVVRGGSRISFDATVLEGKNGIIVCSSDPYSDYQEALLRLAERLKAPVLADPNSNMRNFDHPLIIDSYDAFLKDGSLRKELAPDYILHFGGHPVSKRLFQFVTEHPGALYIQVQEAFQYCNPSLSTAKVVLCSPKDFIESVAITNEESEFALKWRNVQQQMRNKLNGARQEETLFEGRLIGILQEIMPRNSRLVVANSMPIRDVDFFFEAREQEIKVMCNRGANGIDGTISTAMGVAAAKHPTVLLTGDLAFYHDMNGLLMGKTHGLHLVIVLFNNDGGGIFRYLPQSKEKYFEYLFLTPHGVQFEGTKMLYGLEYFPVSDYATFGEVLERAFQSDGVTLIEVKLDSAVSKDVRDKYTVFG